MTATATNSQQISYPRQYRSERRSWKILTDPPWCHRSRFRFHHPYALLHPSRCYQHHVFSFLVVRLDPFRLRGLSPYGDISPGQALIAPVALKNHLGREQEAKEEGEDDEEDACTGVGASGSRGPAGGKEWGRGGGKKGHFHARHGHE